MSKKYKYICALDYDGTLFEGSYPKLGKPKKDVIKQANAFKKCGANLVLWTCREGKGLQEAISRCSKEGLVFEEINENTKEQKEYMSKVLMEKGDIFALRKIYADIYVDDKSPGSIDAFLALDPKDECKEIELEEND